ncbi:unnamed protein product [Prunus armeniaca]|uniref:EF-hand domain-containing protein n=1 Tax=Prunus armeniaca TaxID=36596 RepID=A0A6J5Y2F8_PRUAR|nr:unnamed protein product [Prunus armeniaca]
MAQISSLCVEIETLSQVLGLVEAFKAFDADNDGKINAAEPGGILGSLGYKTRLGSVTLRAIWGFNSKTLTLDNGCGNDTNELNPQIALRVTKIILDDEDEVVTA